MAVFRRKVRGKRQKTWSAKFRFHGVLHTRSGLPDRDTAQHWIDSTRIAMRRGEVGYVKARTSAKVVEGIEQYVAHLRVLNRSETYCRITEGRLTKLATEIPWMTFGDLTAASLESWRASGVTWRKRKVGPRTLNQFCDHARGFGDFLVRRKLLAANPFKGVSHQTAIPRDDYRRAATVDELERLLQAAPPERAAVYRFLIYLPLRRRAVERIEWRDANLTGDRPTFTLRAELSKTKRVCRFALRTDMVEFLASARANAADHDPIFPHVPSVRQLKRDLEKAGVPFDDGRGARRLDLHAFRKTAIRLLKRAGVSLDDAHVFLGHSERRTTERHYDDDRVSGETSDAAAKMPSIGGGK